jgi:hypothetical protein
MMSQDVGADEIREALRLRLRGRGHAVDRGRAGLDRTTSAGMCGGKIVPRDWPRSASGQQGRAVAAQRIVSGPCRCPRALAGPANAQDAQEEGAEHPLALTTRAVGGGSTRRGTES